jgi:hypothetical protein
MITKAIFSTNIKDSLRRVPVLIYLLLLTACNNDKEEEAAIAKTWETYKQATLNRNGQVASSVIDTITTAYYDQLLSLIKTADSNTVEMLRSDQKFLVLCTRHIAGTEKIQSFNGRTYYSFLVQAGFFDGTNIMDNVLKEMNVKGDKAQAKLVDTAKDVTTILDFSKENRDWKINFTLFYARNSQKIWDWLVTESDTTENALMFSVMESMNDVLPDAKVWKPLEASTINP